MEKDEGITIVKHGSNHNCCDTCSDYEEAILRAHTLKMLARDDADEGEAERQGAIEELARSRLERHFENDIMMKKLVDREVAVAQALFAKQCNAASGGDAAVPDPQTTEEPPF